MTTFNVVRRRTNTLDPKRKFLFDYWLALAVLGLAVVGLLVVYSTTFDLGILAHDNDALYFLKRQGAGLLIGLVATILIMQVDYHIFTRFSVPMMVITLAMLVYVLFFGAERFGASRSLTASGSFQPSEVAKLVMILYIAHWIYSKGDKIKSISYGLIPFGLIVGMVVGLILRQPNLSVAILISLIAVIMYFVAGADVKQLAILTVVGLIGLLLAVTFLSHAAERVSTYRASLNDPTQAHDQVQQALIALARGGMFGVGPGQSLQKFYRLPAAHTDGPFAILGEEFGLIGTLTVVFLFAFLAWRGYRTAIKARDMYGALIAIGITSWITFQAVINMAVILSIVPFTGLPMPFLSYGGSSIVMTMVAMGILLNISRDASINRRELKATEKRVTD